LKQFVTGKKNGPAILAINHKEKRRGSIDIYTILSAIFSFEMKVYFQGINEKNRCFYEL